MAEFRRATGRNRSSQRDFDVERQDGRLDVDGANSAESAAAPAVRLAESDPHGCDRDESSGHSRISEGLGRVFNLRLSRGCRPMVGSSRTCQVALRWICHNWGRVKRISV